MHFQLLDGPLLIESYRLRYEIFCEKKQFISPDWFPDRVETDIYDHYSIHIGCIDDNSDLLGTARLVMPPPHGYPIAAHCRLYPEWSAFRQYRMAEISRLALVDRNPMIALGIYKLLYHTSKQHGITHWFAAMEKSLYRLLKRSGFVFEAIGPEQDYYGLVTPYLASIAEIEDNVQRNHPALFDHMRQIISHVEQF